MDLDQLKPCALFIDYENGNNVDSYHPLLIKLNSLGYNPCIRKIISSKFITTDNFEHILKENELEFVLSYKSLKKGSSATIKKKNLNNADFRVYTEVLRTMYKNPSIKTFVIYSSDDDYTELICTLKRENKEVIGVFSKNTTSKDYMNLFHKHIFIEDLFEVKKETQVTKKKEVISKPTPKKEESKKQKATNSNKTSIKQEKQTSKKEAKDNKINKEINIETKKDDIVKSPKDINFYNILKDQTNDLLHKLKQDGSKGPYLIANIVSNLKEHYPYFKAYKKISPEDFKKCGYNVNRLDNKKVKSYINLDEVN